LTESGEASPTIWLEEEVKAKIFSLLGELLRGVGETKVNFVELANTISATKGLTGEGFERVLRRCTGEQLDSEYYAD
jgi:hypothetical protein